MPSDIVHIHVNKYINMPSFGRQIVEDSTHEESVLSAGNVGEESPSLVIRGTKLLLVPLSIVGLV